jgi:cytidine deaminase
MDEKNLVLEAMEARERAYTPYSGFSVGAALLTKGGKIYRGCNIENAAFTPSNCAERTAFFKAVSEGEHEFAAIAVVGGPAGSPPADYCPPCGVCRQVMMEFCDPGGFRIILAKSPEERKVLSLRELLPLGFGKKDLKKEGDAR